MDYIGVMQTAIQSPTMEHPLDVLRAAIGFAENNEPFALAIVTETEGGAVRAPGAMMAIGASGDFAGYVSGGCIDSDVRIRAQIAIEQNKPERLKYGKGSPFLDIRLPCGGSIDLTLLPNPDEAVVRRSIKQLESQQSIALDISNGHLNFADQDNRESQSFRYRPKLNLRIAGRGIEPISLAKIAIAGGLTCELWTTDENCISDARNIKGLNVVPLASPTELPNITDSAETAFVLMFHDKDWETALLRQAVSGPAFYIGAVGSKSTHAARRQQLIESGMTDSGLSRVRGPIGLVPSMRDASMLAYSILAEIVSEFHAKSSVPS